MSLPHPSDSLAQRDAERFIVAAVADDVGVSLVTTRVDLGGGVRAEFDGASEDRSVVVEAFAHVGALRGAQPKKLATDAFKLTWAGRRVGASRLIIAVLDERVEAYLRRPRAWLTAALLDAGVEVLRVDVDPAVLSRVEAAQRAQFMSGVSGDDG
ncbi:hypothetical protein [Curtobacterium sp. MCBD17_040]|uniref:hypothetical protein n=1 Tax=Curtobacterium sp. MCBD17_040 TaxID=2175674 RepID=UPI000DA6FE09|nr:hypothetical protein [Curtobacterium sp. MCBD17_040]WIB65296.1 hypothetical protein DEI94_17985 [Curtobacterium sp. MCBD17_040]